MSIFRHSTVLFTDDDCHPMKFFMRPCAEKQRLHPLIEHGGGVLSSKLTNGMYKLIEPGSKILNESNNCISSQFILDCVEKNCLQDMEKYKIKIETAEVSDISEDETSKYTIKTTKRSTRARHEYTDTDDYIILDYVLKSKRYNETKGKSIWVNLQDRNALPNRTWQSLRERYIKKIIPHIYKYDISEKQRKLLSNPFTRNGEESDTHNDSEDLYTASNDLLIVNSLFENNRLHKINEDIVWKEIEETKKTNHSWKSLKNRFFKKIIPALNNYNLSLQQLNELNSAVKIPPLVLMSARNAAKKLTSNRTTEKSHTSLISGNESSTCENINFRTKRKFAIMQPIVLEKDNLCKNTMDKSIANISEPLSEQNAKKEKQVIEKVSDLCRSPHKNDTNEELCPQTLKSPSSDITNFHSNCVAQYRFQRRMPKVPLKRLSMKAIQQHVAEIESNPSRKQSLSSVDFQGQNLESPEKQNQQTSLLGMELSPKEMLDLQASVTVQNIIDALDGEWPETLEENVLKLSHEDSDDSNSTTIHIINANGLRKVEDTTETSTTEKSVLQQNNVKSTQNMIDAKKTVMFKECSVPKTGSALTNDSSDNGCETSSETKQDTTDVFCSQQLKYKRLRGGRQLIKKPTTKPHHTLDVDNHTIPSTKTRRKRNIDDTTDNSSEVTINQDLTISNTLNIALKHVKSIKEICENWHGSSDVSDISIPVNSVNYVLKELNELQTLLYKTQLIFLSSEILKKSQSNIDEDDILILLKFLLVHGNCNLENITNIIANKTSHC